jgi:hypothetical protein
LRSTRINLSKHRRSAHGVPVPERYIVRFVDVAGFEFVFEIIERTEQKSPFFFELCEPVKVCPTPQGG